jgi:hypothetical protein
MTFALWPVIAILAGVPQEPSNVTPPQVEVKQVRNDAFGYARLGTGRVLAADGSPNPVLGFGLRAETEDLGLDVSFINYQLPSSGVYATSGTIAGSLLKLEGLCFFNPQSNGSAYLGGGLSWGVVTGSHDSAANSFASWHGSGLQGEMTAGYELPQINDLHLFIQADATLPFYFTTGQTVTYSGSRASTVVFGHRYNPSVALSVGVGWHHHHR